jgi:hypothetical protein
MQELNHGVKPTKGPTDSCDKDSESHAAETDVRRTPHLSDHGATAGLPDPDVAPDPGAERRTPYFGSGMPNWDDRSLSQQAEERAQHGDVGPPPCEWPKR